MFSAWHESSGKFPRKFKIKKNYFRKNYKQEINVNFTPTLTLDPLDRLQNSHLFLFNFFAFKNFFQPLQIFLFKSSSKHQLPTVNLNQKTQRKNAFDNVFPARIVKMFAFFFVTTFKSQLKQRRKKVRLWWKLWRLSIDFLFAFVFFQIQIAISNFSLSCLFISINTAPLKDVLMMETHRSSNKIASNGGQFPASTFPETFKDFFSMINEDEDQVELVSNVLEDKVNRMEMNVGAKGRRRGKGEKFN